MMPPIHNIGVDLNQDVLNELDEVAQRLNVSRQALIKFLIRQGLDQHHLAQSVREAS